MFPCDYLKNTVLVLIFLIPVTSFSLTNYIVNPGDTLWEIANSNRPSKISTTNMIKAIKGLNLDNSPNIINNVIKANEKIILPITAQQVNDAIKVYNAHQTNFKPISTNRKIPQVKIAPANDIVNTNQSNLISQPLETVKEPPKKVQDFSEKIEKTESKKNILMYIKTHYKQIIPWIIVILLSFYLLNRRNKYKKKTAITAKQRFSGGIPKKHKEPEVFENNTFISIHDSLDKAQQLIQKGYIKDAKVYLQNTLNIYNDNVEIRIKLLEIYAAEKDIISFNSERDYLAAHLIDHKDKRWEEIDRLYDRYFIKS